MAKSDKIYFENFIQCTEYSRKAAKYLAECLENYDPDTILKMLEQMHEIEHSADMKKHEMNDMLIKAFVTPVDREDLDLISQKLDDVTDTLEEILQKFYIYDIKTIRPDAITFAHKITDACDILCEIMGEFENFKKSKKMKELIIDLNNVEEDCDKLYLSSMRALTTDGTDRLEIVSWRKIYEHLEACADECEHVGECIRSVIMKNT